jgi:hypothetical protein
LPEGTGTGTGMHFGSGTLFGSGSNIRWSKKVKKMNERPTSWEITLLLRT